MFVVIKLILTKVNTPLTEFNLTLARSSKMAATTKALSKKTRNRNNYKTFFAVMNAYINLDTNLIFI